MVLGKIYKIVVAQSNDIYIGSTFDDLAQRFKRHKKQYKLWKEGKTNGCGSFDLFDKYGIDNCKTLLIKEYDVVDRKHLQMYEQLWINRLCLYNVNIQSAFSIKKLYFKQWRQEHKEEQSEYGKKWREEHKDTIKQKRKEYETQNRVKISQKKREKITCKICNCEIARSGKTMHERTKKHLNNSLVKK